MLWIAGMNYFVDPFGYFHFIGGDYNRIDFQLNTEYYMRFLEAERIRHYKDQYDAYIVGGSKAGSYQAEKLRELDGYRYYNVWASGGSVQNYYYYAKYILENTDAKKIVMNLSGGEVRGYDRQYMGDVCVIPAQVKGDSVFLERLDFLFKDVHVAMDTWKERRDAGSLPSYYNADTGDRNLLKYYRARAKDPEAFAERRVLEDFDKQMKRLFTKKISHDAYEENLAAIREIRDLCREKGVEFMLVVAPAFIGEMSEHECEAYWEYMEELAVITDYWDFSGYNDIDMNPYNFCDEGHFLYEVTDLIVDTITGKDSYEGFGTYVTLENVYDHIQERKERYLALQQEYKETGTIQLLGYEDESNVVGDGSKYY
ncbi:MAG TPA: hypothetical protein DF613_15290 [Lachnospiraceae bacterium]|nr:hypothetical protein [Lachnospiraceae bacterium]